MIKISIVCSASTHPVNRWLFAWKNNQASSHSSIEIVRQKADLSPSDLVFLISCNEIFEQRDRAPHGAVLVIHASDLPQGRGWSPHIWQILEGRQQITVSLLEAADGVDSGAIWAQTVIDIPDHFLYEEINKALFDAELKLMDYAVSHFGKLSPSPQNQDIKPTYYRKRKPLDSELDPESSIAGQFDLMRVCDPDRFPAFFRFRGHMYKVRLEKMGERTSDND